MLILNKLNWSLFLETPIELVYSLISEISTRYNYNPTYSYEIYNSIIDLISYCFSELNIYVKYTQFEIAISCIKLVLEIYSEDRALNEFTKSLIDIINWDDVIFNNVNNCKIVIKNNFNSDDNSTSNNINNNHFDNEVNSMNLVPELEKSNLSEINSKGFVNSISNSNFSTIDLEDDTEADFDKNSESNCDDFDTDIYENPLN